MVRKNARREVAELNNHRVNALIGQALDLICADERDPAKRIAEEFWKTPLAWCEWAEKRAGGASAGAGGLTVNLAGFFGAMGATIPESVIESSDDRVQSGCIEGEAIEW